MKKLLAFIFLCSLMFASIEDEKLLYGKLDNGLNYFIRTNSFPKDLAYIYLVVNTGSIDESEKQLGIAHLVEHLAFSGTKDYNQDDIIKTLENLGVKFGSHLNASTSFDSTIYKLQIKTSNENIIEALKVLENIASKVSFEDKAIEREKRVVTEEDRVSNSSSMRIFKQELPYIFPKSIYEKRLPIGDMEIIKNSSRQNIVNFYEDNYFPKNMSLIAVGDFDEQKVLEFIKEKFADLKNKAKKKEIDKKIAFFDETIYFNPFDDELINDGVRVYFESQAYKINSFENLKKDIINSFVVKAFSLFNDNLISNKLIVKPIQFNTTNLYNQKILHIFSQNSIKKDYKESLGKIFSAINYLKIYGFSDDEFSAVKKELISKNENFLNTISTRKSEYFLNYYLDYLQSGSFILSEEKIYNLSREILKNITLDDINQAFNEIVLSNGVLIEVISQKPFKLNLKDIERLKLTKPFKIKKADTLNNQISNLNLKPINFTSYKYNAKDGIYMYEFKNGVEVFFKPLNDDKDSIDFRFVALGGSTNIDDLKSAQIAIKSANQSGIGDLNEYEYQKFKKGKLFYFIKYIDEVSRGYEGQAQLNSFEDMLKAFYIDFTNPKIDASTLERHARVSIDFLEKNEENPEYKFAKDQNEVYFNSNSKLAFFEKKDFYGLKIRQLCDFIRTKFSNSGEFYLIVTGDIKKDEFETLIKKYIGNLPGNKTGEIIKDDKIRPIDTNETFERFYAKDNIAKVKIIINNQKAKYSEFDKEVFNATASILSNILREKIRAEQGRVYGISVYNQLVKIPYPKSQIAISFSSNPQNRYEIIEDIKKQIENLGDIDQSYLDNYKKMIKIELAKRYKENGFWKNQIDNYILTGEEIRSLQERVEMVDKITMEDIKNALNEYLLSDASSNFISIYAPEDLKAN